MKFGESSSAMAALTNATMSPIRFAAQVVGPSHPSFAHRA
jgi:hypothetical protein